MKFWKRFSVSEWMSKQRRGVECSWFCGHPISCFQQWKCCIMLRNLGVFSWQKTLYRNWWKPSPYVQVGPIKKHKEIHLPWILCLWFECFHYRKHQLVSSRLPRQISYFIDISSNRVKYVVLWSNLVRLFEIYSFQNTIQNSFRYPNPPDIWAGKE